MQSGSRRYPQRRELSSSARGGPNGAKARALKFPHFRPGPHKQKVTGSLAQCTYVKELSAAPVAPPDGDGGGVTDVSTDVGEDEDERARLTN